ncbi:cytochrome P450 [Pontibacillus sp. ALD_SL1]|uniref:cytochrome P450 family protein n=1 Tax=Pontibacillus sp. ALD_SL1 TaxID=2777185 RepID=UPI001A962C30|nr:cytochrome P450 [Pontibacillus sp. ALD_SL1]QSS98690.1 cytochrome P450 [Pontibacillus sp. ALD_SL1]
MSTKEKIFQSQFKEGAYPFYEELRQENPIFKMSEVHNQTTWMVTRYSDVKELLKTPSFLKDFSKLYPNEDEESVEQNIFSNMMLDLDPPDHTRLRKLVTPYFNPTTISSLSPRIDEIAKELIEEMKEKQGPVDLIDEFAFPLPIIVISELLGVPAEDRNSFRKWSNTIVSASEGEHPQFSQDVKDFVVYLCELFERRRHEPKDDLISNLIQAEEEGEQLSRNELYSMVVLLIIAGHETTVNLIANTIYALLQHPDQFNKLKEDHSLIESAIEEGLRYYSPVDFSTARWVEDDREFHGKTLKQGDVIFASLSSANRDEQKFKNASNFDITRSNNQHVAFGFGFHFCLGAPLARLEGKIALRHLLTSCPNLELARHTPPTWRKMFLLRGLEQLKVRL